MLTYLDLRNHVLLAIGGRPSTATGQTVAQRQAEIVNIAGEHLFTHPWKFREKTATLSLVAAQEYVVLPSDFGELMSAWKGDTPIAIVTPEILQNYRLTTFPDWQYKAAIRTVVPTTGSPTQTFRLELYPTPTANETDVVKITYRFGWQGVTSSTPDATVISIPSSVEATLISYVRAVAESYEDGMQSQRFAEIEAGPIFGAAQRKDGMIQTHFGQLGRNVWRSSGSQDAAFLMINPLQNPS